MRTTLLVALAVLLGATLALPQPSPTPWWRTAVCPMVGPFNRTSGPQGKTPEQILDDFQPEVAEWSCLPELTNHPHATRKILGGLEYQEFPQGPKRDYQLWQDKFGAAFTPTEDDGVAVNSTGKLQELKYGSETPTLYYVCHHAPRWHDFHKDSIIRAAQDPKCELVRQDNIAGPSGVGWDNGGWCKWCLAGYKQRLAGQFTPDQLRTLGVPDLAAFDARAYLQAALKQPVEERLEDPLVRAYVRYMLKSNLDLWADECAAAHAVRADIPICGNQGSGGLPPYPNVLLSDVSDLIFLESSRRAFTRDPSSVYYAVTLAGGRHSKPAWIWDFSSEAYMQQADGSRLFMAECYANGATPYYEMNNLGHSRQKGYYAIALGARAYDALATYARFAREHRNLLAESYAAATPVALLYSVPTFAPRYMGSVVLGGNHPQTAKLNAQFMGWARALEASHVPYNVEVLGDEELWPDRNLPERLARYKVLIIPAVDAITDAQLQALEAFRGKGGRLVISGLFATRHADFAPRTIPPDWSHQARVTRLQDEPVDFHSARAVNASCGASQIVTINQAEPKPLVVRGWSKAEGVSGPTDNQYSLWVDAQYQDGTPLWAQTASFRAGTHGWEMAEVTLHPAKPIKSMHVHALFRYHSGKAWFDDLFVGEAGSDKNLLANPGLEGGDGKEIPGWLPFLGWQKTAASYTPDKSTHGGAQSIMCFVPEPTTEPPAELKMREIITQMLAGAGPRLQTDAPRSLFIRPVRKGQQMVVHLLNLDYDGDADQSHPCGAFGLTIPLPTGTEKLAGPVTLMSPDGDQKDVTLEGKVEQGAVTVTVPGVRVWSLISLTGK